MLLAFRGPGELGQTRIVTALPARGGREESFRKPSSGLRFLRFAAQKNALAAYLPLQRTPSFTAGLANEHGKIAVGSTNEHGEPQLVSPISMANRGWFDQVARQALV